LGKDLAIQVKNTPQPTSDMTTIKIGTFVISLKRRKDRLEQFTKNNMKKLGNLRVNLFEAIDGKELISSQKIYKLFETGDFHYNRGIIGCAMSHIKLWKLFLESDLDMMLVFEDDSVLCENFPDILLSGLKKNTKPWDIIFLGHHSYPQYREKQSKPTMDNVVFENWTLNTRIQKSMGGTFSYIINKNGAAKMIDELSMKGCYNAIDWVMFKHPDSIILYSHPHLITCENPEEDKTGDIQGKKECINADNWIKEDLNYFKQLTKATGVKIDLSKQIDIDEKEDENSPILFTDKLQTKDTLLSHITFFEFKSLEEISQLVLRLPVNCYSLDKYLVIVPKSKCTADVYKTITFNTHLNFDFPV